MAIPAKPTLTAPPTAPVRGEDRASFATKANAYVVFIGTNVTDLTAAIDWQNTVFTATETEATNAAASAVTAAAEVVLAGDQVALAIAQVALAADEVDLAEAAAAAAVATANAEAWVSGASYDINDNAISQINFKTYRAKSTFTGQTTDPSADETRWVDVIPEPTAILQPSNVSPVDNATDIGSGPLLTGSPFYSLYGLPMVAGQWQVSTDETFATTVIDTGDVAGSFISFTATGLLVSTTYYWRLRYKDDDGVYSEYSVATEFATSSSFFPENEVAKLMASDAQESDQFGYSVSVSGDTAVIGARYEDTGGSDAGAAYVFTRSGGSWTQQAKLMASDAQSSDRFGGSVAVSGDTAVIGASNADAGGSGAGAAYVFTRTGGSWTQQAKLMASDAQANDNFGYSVAVSGDTAVIGAPYEDTGGSDAGAVYVFTRTGGSWTQQAKLMASDAQANDNFGYSVAVSGDTAVIGARLEATGGSGAGAAYVFTRTGGSWTQQAKLMASDAQVNDYFGWSVAVSGDTAVIGAQFEDTGGSGAGAAYVFTRTGGSWTQQAKLMASDAQANDNFGYSVSVSGDTAVIGARLEDTGGSGAGAAYVFTRTGGSWTQQAKLMASDAQANDVFGWSVAVSGDTAVIGAPYEDTGGSDAGAVYVFE